MEQNVHYHNLGLSMKVQAADKSDLTNIVLIFSLADVKIKIGSTSVVVSPAVQYGEIIDVYVTCNETNFKVPTFYKNSYLKVHNITSLTNCSELQTNCL